ncbi:hypothetical protein [Ruminococcus albus]|uniref:Uncharacterized protein n=1 Tax=Ruminococcus albus (strain ATCC 27210 / DSM 20455 / JCM 14654 / NCDO 2250 / 7) TaxID=697329 RepID=E6UCQ3_RUMA7|nr:hypothetical protein [Ruminococcus albus]ADU22732.1 hypothetical protein Rumal_2246 [Ruminococcus albus 7 = DSM 20455]
MKKTRISVIICAVTVIAVLMGMVINTIQTGAIESQGMTTLAVCTVMYVLAKKKYTDLLKQEQTL